jgi:hypothetical protein
MKKLSLVIFWITAVVSTSAALSAETALPESYKITNFSRPSNNITDWVKSFAKFHKVIVTPTAEKLMISKAGQKVGFDEALKTLGFTAGMLNTERGDNEKEAIEFIRENLVSNGPVYAVVYNDKDASMGYPGLILSYDDKTEKFEIWMLIAGKQETIRYKDLIKRVKRLINYTKPETVTAEGTLETLSKIVRLTAGLKTYDEVESALRNDKTLKVYEKEGLSRRLNETEEKSKAVSVTNQNGFEMLKVAMKTSPVIIIPQTSGDSAVLMFHKEAKTGDTVCRKLVGGKWVESPMFSLSNANGKRLIEVDGKWSLPILQVGTGE